MMTLRSRLQTSFLCYKTGVWPLEDLLLASRAFAVSIARLEGREDAEDLAQEVCVRVWTGIDSFDGRRASCATWLRKILRNLIRDKVRHSRSVLSGSRIVETPEHEAARDDSDDAPRRHLDDLPPARLTPWQLQLVGALVDGNELRDIADATGLTLGAVRSRFDRIRDKCRG